jgi:hypothetical protein
VRTPEFRGFILLDMISPAGDGDLASHSFWMNAKTGAWRAFLRESRNSPHEIRLRRSDTRNRVPASIGTRCWGFGEKSQ